MACQTAKVTTSARQGRGEGKADAQSAHWRREVGKGFCERPRRDDEGTRSLAQPRHLSSPPRRGDALLLQNQAHQPALGRLDDKEAREEVIPHLRRPQVKRSAPRGGTQNLAVCAAAVSNAVAAETSDVVGPAAQSLDDQAHAPLPSLQTAQVTLLTLVAGAATGRAPRRHEMRCQRRAHFPTSRRLASSLASTSPCRLAKLHDSSSGTQVMERRMERKGGHAACVGSGPRAPLVIRW